MLQERGGKEGFMGQCFGPAEDSDRGAMAGSAAGVRAVVGEQSLSEDAAVLMPSSFLVMANSRRSHRRGLRGLRGLGGHVIC